MFQVDVLEQDAFEVLRLILSLKNELAPINRIPPDVLTLIPDFWDKRHRDKDLIALTHVCQAWREIFISRSSLWTGFECVDAEKNLKRSQSSPLDLWIWRTDGRPPHDLFLPPHDPFLEVISHAIGRLKSLSITASLKILPGITAQLFFPAPLLESLSLCGGYRTRTWYNPALATSLFNGDLSSLRVLHLQCVRTELPWRNMINLT